VYDSGELQKLGIERQPDLAGLFEIHFEPDAAVDDAQVDHAAKPAEIRLIANGQDRLPLGALEQTDIRRCDVQHVTSVNDIAAAKGSHPKRPVPH
jgi:hypothetical protein